MKSLGIFMLGLVILSACSMNEAPCSDFSKDLRKLAAAEAAMRCQLVEINQESRQLWNAYNDQLKTAFAPSTNEFIKGKMLEMRNAELLRMFQSFDSIDMTAKKALLVTEKADRTFAKQMDSIQQELNILEKKKMAAYLDMELQCPESLEKVRENYQIILKRNCNAL